MAQSQLELPDTTQADAAEAVVAEAVDDVQPRGTKRTNHHAAGRKSAKVHPLHQGQRHFYVASTPCISFGALFNSSEKLSHQTFARSSSLFFARSFDP